jgi:hypothetical protein
MTTNTYEIGNITLVLKIRIFFQFTIKSESPVRAAPIYIYI